MFDIKIAIKIAKYSEIIYKGFSDMQDLLVGKDWQYFERKDTQAMIVHDGINKEIFIIYRGTTSLADWKTDAQTKKKYTQWGGISEGVLWAESATQNDIVRSLKFIYNDLYKVYIGGHSLGGGLALRAALRVRDELKIPVAGVYTFGCPQIFDRDGRAEYNRLLGDCTYRLVHGLDMITFLPWQLHDTHVGVLSYIDKHNNIWADELGHEEGRKRKRQEQFMDGCQNACTFGLFRVGHSMERYFEALGKGRVV